MPEESGICAIVPLDQDGFGPQVFGMGIFISDREVVTCAHVINLALGSSWQDRSGEGVVRISFPFAEESLCINGSVDRSRWFPPGKPKVGTLSDIAVIQLSQGAPPSLGRAILLEHKADTEVKAFGFRGKELGNGAWQSHHLGEWVIGKIVGPNPGGFQFDGISLTGAAVEKGFSGAGVYDIVRDAVVGMVVEADREKEKKISHCIDVPSLLKALGRAAIGGGLAPPSSLGRQRVVPEALAVQAQEKLQEIEAYLLEIVTSLPAPDPDAGLLSVLQSFLEEDNQTAARLRTAFGFPKAAGKARMLYELVSSGEPSMQPILGLLAQRMNHLLWRLEYTLAAIPGEWPKKARSASEALRTICEPHLLAQQPTLLDLSAALEFEKDLKAFSESAPDPTLYAVLRAFDHSQSHSLPAEHEIVKRARSLALDFMFDYLEDLVEGRRQVDDSSNVWWALRTGIRAGDDRFRHLLPRVAAKYNDVNVPPEHVSRLAAVPEIHKPIRTTSYTLSNVQDIFECGFPMEDALAERLHGIILVMVERLLGAPRSFQLYLASVHHEGLRNFLDYIKDREVPVT